jgi:hypothetical protein
MKNKFVNLYKKYISDILLKSQDLKLGDIIDKSFCEIKRIDFDDYIHQFDFKDLSKEKKYASIPTEISIKKNNDNYIMCINKTIDFVLNNNDALEIIDIFENSIFNYDYVYFMNTNENGRKFTCIKQIVNEEIEI